MGRKYELGEETVERYAGGGVQGVVQVGMMPGKVSFAVGGEEGRAYLESLA